METGLSTSQLISPHSLAGSDENLGKKLLRKLSAYVSKHLYPGYTHHLPVYYNLLLIHKFAFSYFEKYYIYYIFSF